MSRSRAYERLRQERETFDAHKAQDGNWFRLRLFVGYLGMLLLVAITIVLGWITLHPGDFTPQVGAFAASGLFVEVLGLAVWIARTAFSANAVGRLRPVTGKDEAGKHQETGSRPPRSGS